MWDWRFKHLRQVNIYKMCMYFFTFESCFLARLPKLQFIWLIWLNLGLWSEVVVVCISLESIRGSKCRFWTHVLIEKKGVRNTRVVEWNMAQIAWKSCRLTLCSSAHFPAQVHTTSETPRSSAWCSLEQKTSGELTVRARDCTPMPSRPHHPKFRYLIHACPWAFE